MCYRVISKDLLKARDKVADVTTRPAENTATAKEAVDFQAERIALASFMARVARWRAVQESEKEESVW